MSYPYAYTQHVPQEAPPPSGFATGQYPQYYPHQQGQAGPQWVPMTHLTPAQPSRFVQQPQQHQQTQSHHWYYPSSYTRVQDLPPDPSPSPQPDQKPLLDPSVSKPRTSRRGLKTTLLIHLILSTLALSINLIWYIYAKNNYAAPRPSDNPDAWEARGWDSYSFGTISEGICDGGSMFSTTSLLKLGVNVLSTVLLMGSSAFAQAYGSPSWEEVRAGHGRGRGLDVGISLRNLVKGGIGWGKRLVVLLLVGSSLPFHLLYNSMIYPSTATHGYLRAIVTTTFLDQTIPYESLPLPYASYWGEDLAILPLMHAKHPTYERLSNSECVAAYTDTFRPNRRHLILVSSAANDTTSVLSDGYEDLWRSVRSNFWMCSKDPGGGPDLSCNPSLDLGDVDESWEVFGFPIEYCLSERVEEQCSLRYDYTIALVILIFTGIKLVVEVFLWFRWDVRTLVTCVGDAVSGFLSQGPDPTTAGMCLVSKKEVKKRWRRGGYGGMTPMAYTGKAKRWFSSVGKLRWSLLFAVITSIYLFFIPILVIGFYYLRSYGVSIGSAASMGFGRLDSRAMLLYDKYDDLPLIALLSNLPQLFLAISYIVQTGILRTMFASRDFHLLGSSPRPLRVSSPVVGSSQLGTLAFGIPLTYGLVVTGLNLLMHWLVSQSLFLVQLDIFNPVQGNLDAFERYFTNAGYSPIAAIVTLVVGLVLPVLVVGLGVRKLGSGKGGKEGEKVVVPPLVSSSTVAISAACHPGMLGVKGMELGELRWGSHQDGVYGNGWGHCSIVPAASWGTGAGPPVVGGMYA